MYIPTHYAIVLFAILFLESGALFIYTLIGLLKSNPLPYIMPAAPQYPAYQYPAPPMLQAPQTVTSIHTTLLTTTVSKTMLVQQGPNGIETIDISGSMPGLRVTHLTLSGAEPDSIPKSTATSSTSTQTSSSRSSSSSISVTSTKSSSSTKASPPPPVIVKTTIKQPPKSTVVVLTKTLPPP